VELRKGKYKQAEVEELLDACEKEYVDKIMQLRCSINELSEKNADLIAENSLLKENEALISSALQDAQKSLKNKEKSCELQYETCKKSIKVFLEKWREYFNSLLEKYPYYPAIKQAEALRGEVEKVFSANNGKTAIDKAKKTLDKANKTRIDFNPKEKIQDYIAVTSDNGFNLDEVLNPGTLHLEDLCKELGLLDEND
jgi:sugar-specific transcriptional regulator TrmB